MGAAVVRSAGPDGRYYTNDDIFPHHSVQESQAIVSSQQSESVVSISRSVRYWLLDCSTAVFTLR